MSQTAIEAAPLLLGCFLNRKSSQGLLKLRIVETEAYHQDDPASHSYAGQTTRTRPMFQVGGHIYVYFTYGVHYCLNIVTGPAGQGEAVLIRAAEPMEGTGIMKRNRGVERVEDIANGPGKVAQALGIRDTSLSGQLLNSSSIFLEPPASPIRQDQIIIGPRIGITKAVEAQMRFYLKDNPFVSRRTIRP